MADVARARTSGGALLVPVAVDAAGTWLLPDEALDGARYACPDCKSRVVVREGESVVRHFAHFRHPAACGFAGESAEHLAAKYLVAAAVKRWTAGRALSPQVRTRCRTCDATAMLRPLRRCIADASVEAEVVIPGAAARVRLDVALTDATGRVRLGVEVRRSHAVPEEKGVRLGRAKIPWIEVEAQGLYGRATQDLLAIRGGGVDLVHECETCREARLAEGRRMGARGKAEALARPRTRFERSLASQPSWTKRQREALGAHYPQPRAARILAELRRAYPNHRELESVEGRWKLTGKLTPRQVATILRIAQRQPSGLALAESRNWEPANIRDGSPARVGDAEAPTLFQGE